MPENINLLINTAACTIRYRVAVRQTWPVPKDAVDSDIRLDYAFAAAHIDPAHCPPGWVLPESWSDANAIERAYQATTERVSRADLDTMSSRAGDFYRPLGDAVTMDASALTDDQKKTST